MKKIISGCLLVVTVVLLLAACTPAETTPVYKTDVAVDTLSAAAAEKIANYSAMSKIDEMYFKYQLTADTATISQWDVRLMTGTALDEIGIFKAASAEDVETVKQMATDYLARRNEEWTGLYLVEEYPKLRDAEVKVYGEYVVYAILSEAEKSAVFTAIETALTK